MFTLHHWTQFKQSGKKITVVTAYDYFSAQIAEAAEIDVILVGDSLGMVIAGNENTLSVTLDEMIYHTKAVKKGAPRSFIIADMPYLSYHITPAETVRNAGRLIQETQVNAIKVEMNHPAILEHIEALVAAQIPVIGHIGMTPQSVNVFGGFKVQGRENEEAHKITAFAHQLVQVGVKAIVLECMPAALAKTITQQISVATIGIGSGQYCDGQVLVFHDLLGFNPKNKFKFVKCYANAHEYLVNGLKNFASDVKSGVFPDETHSH